MSRLNKIQTALFVLVIMVTIPISAYAVDGQRKISQTPSTTFPIVINQSGSYVLTSNLVVTNPNQHGIEITVNDVTIDLNGHMIRGPYTVPNPDGSGSGIYAFNKNTIAVKNGRIWGFAQYGIFLDNDIEDPSYNGAGHLIDKIQAVNNGLNGINICSGLCMNCIANGNGEKGINTGNSTITNCTANGNILDGIYSRYSSITNCTANKNGRHGIQSDQDIITNCSASDNGLAGIFAYETSINNCTCNHNYAEGFKLNYSSVTNGLANSNQDGIAATASNITNCIITDNINNGITSNGDNRIEGNTLDSNGDSIMHTGNGIHLVLGGFNNYVVRNVARHSGNNNYQDDGSSNYMPLSGDNANH